MVPHSCLPLFNYSVVGYVNLGSWIWCCLIIPTFLLPWFFLTLTLTWLFHIELAPSFMGVHSKLQYKWSMDDLWKAWEDEVNHTCLTHAEKLHEEANKQVIVSAAEWWWQAEAVRAKILANASSRLHCWGETACTKALIDEQLAAECTEMQHQTEATHAASWWREHLLWSCNVGWWRQAHASAKNNEMHHPAGWLHQPWLSTSDTRRHPLPLALVIPLNPRLWQSHKFRPHAAWWCPLHGILPHKIFCNLCRSEQRNILK